MSIGKLLSHVLVSDTPVGVDFTRGSLDIIGVCDGIVDDNEDCVFELFQVQITMRIELCMVSSTGPLLIYVVESLIAFLLVFCGVYCQSFCSMYLSLQPFYCVDEFIPLLLLRLTRFAPDFADGSNTSRQVEANDDEEGSLLSPVYHDQTTLGHLWATKLLSPNKKDKHSAA